MNHLQLLRNDFYKLSENFERLAGEAIRQGVTRYPIFVASTEPLALGLSIVDARELGTTFSYGISHLEELVRRGVIPPEKVADFKRAFVNPLGNACVLIALPNEFQFVFVPYQSDP